jgi:hypothetical protein
MMSTRTSKNLQALIAIGLLVSLLAPPWHMGAASGTGLDKAQPPQTDHETASPATAPGDLASVPGASADWWAAVQQQIDQDRYALIRSEPHGGVASYRAGNPVHAFDIAFSADGVSLAPAGRDGLTASQAAWVWKVRLTGYGYEGRVQPLRAPLSMKADGSKLAFGHARLTEWYVNSQHGLEQGFVLEAPPPGAEAGRALVLQMALDTGLVPVLSDDARTIDFLQAPGSAAVLRYTHLAVVDAGGNELPAHLSVTPGRISIWIDDTRATYPLLVDPIVITPDWVIESDQVGARLGTSVATAGDVNGDGYADVIVGVPGYDGAYSKLNAGRAYVYYGSAAGLSLSPDWFVEGTWQETWLGASVSTAGDVNNDGYDDVIIGAPGRGYVYIYHGSSAGLPANPNRTLSAAELGFGSTVGPAGNVNRDQYADVFVVTSSSSLIRVYHGSSTGVGTTAQWSGTGNAAAAVGGGLVVGQPNYSNGQTEEGQVLFYPGSSTGLGASSGWHYESNVAGARLGHSVALAGDVNGDGFDDVIVGAPGYTNGQRGEGRALVFHGPFSSVSSGALAWTAESDQEDAAFGYAVGTAGDVNGDGYADVIVGAPGFDGGQLNEGRVFVYYGSSAGLGGLPQWTAEGGRTDAALGHAVGMAGDVNGDGYGDIIAGAPGFDNGQTDEGRAYLFPGSSPVITDHQWSAEGGAPGDEFGRSVATAGDVNGDGYSDVVVGAPFNSENGVEAGKVYVYYGGPLGLSLTPAWTALGEAENDGFGRVVGTAGDLNGDGYDDLVVGAPGRGKVYVYYGSAAGLGAAGWTANGQYLRDEFGGAVSTAGDVNRDGYDDLVVGAAGYPNGNAYGKVYLYHGSSNGLGSTAAWIATGTSAGERFGGAVATAGDVNADGFADVIIGVPLRNRVHVYHGGPAGLAPGAANWTATGETGSQFGYAVAMAGDVNGDGYSDIVIGAPLFNASGLADAGRAYVYYGAVTGLSPSASWSVTGASAGNRLGTAVFTAGDINGDRYADVVIGAYGSGSLAGQIQIYRGGSGGLPSTPNRTISGEAAADRLGLAVAAAGDVNGDGFGDFIAGAPGYDGLNGANVGRVTVYHGEAVGPGGDWGPQGRVIRAAGDVDGDGYSDVIIYNWPVVSGMTSHRVYIYYGSGTGLSQGWEWRSGTDFRLTVGTAGDVNGDGYADVFVSDADTVRLFYGSATGLTPGDWPYTMPPDWSASICGGTGCAVATAGDLDGDGFSDVVIGHKSTNRVWIYYGSPTGLANVAGWTHTGTDDYGGTVATAGDVNGDGYADLIVTGNSTLYVYHGSVAGLASGAPDLTFTVEGSPGAPCTAATAGDVNGDGYADVVVGAPYTNNSKGKVYLFYGAAGGLDAPLVELMGGAFGDEFGTSVATAGDVNGDGYADVLVGAPKFAYDNRGKAYLYYGSALGLRADQEPWTETGINWQNYGFGSLVGAAGDVDGDGFGDLAISNNAGTGIAPVVSLQRGNGGGGRLALARQTRGDGSRMLVQPWGRSTRDSFAVLLRALNPLGRGYTRLQVQACPSAVPFGDASCREYTATNWTEVVDAAGVDLREMAEGLQEDTLYRWRARLLYDSPFTPRGPWYRFLGQGQEADVRVGRLATDLRITMTMEPATELVIPAQITYTLTYESTGGPAAGVVITDILPASLDNVQITSSGPTIQDTGVRPGYVWSVGDMAAGERGIITIIAQANATRFVNIAEIAGTSRDVNPANNVAMVQTQVPGILYVNAGARGANNGTSWVDAYTDLQEALATARSGDQIWVAAGTYKPTTGLNRSRTFSLVSGVAIYGGFAGNEAYLHDRDWQTHTTVLSGDIGTVGNNVDNVYHVVTAFGVTSSAVLDGFVISGGRATGLDDNSRGGGIYIDNASPTLRYLSLLGNTAEHGGGIYNNGGSPSLVNLVLSGNAATTGGALYNAAGNPSLINNTLSQNAATLGGALYNAGSATLANCIVWDEDSGQNLIAGPGTTTVTYSNVRGGAPGTGNLDADPQFVNAKGADGIAGTPDDDLRLRTTYRRPSPVIDRGSNAALPLDAGDLNGDGDKSEPVPFDASSRARVIGFTALPPMVDMGAYEANIEDVLAEGDALLAEGITFRKQRLQLLPAETQELALLNYSNFNDGEWYYAFCSDYDKLDADGYCPVIGPEHVRNDLLDTVDVYRVAVNVWPMSTWTTRNGTVIQVWERGGQGVLGGAVEIGNVHLIFGGEYLVDATDYRFSTAGLPYADQIIGQELKELERAARQFELVMDLVFRAFSEWHVGDYANSDQFETFGVASSLLMSALDEMASRYYMMNQSQKAREVYLEASRNQNMHLTALAELAEQTGHAYLVNGSWEMLNNISRMRERARQIEAGFDFFGFRPDYAPLQPFEQLLRLTEGPSGNAGLLGTARDLEDQARNAQRDFDTNRTKMATELDLWRYELDSQLFELCGETEDLDGDGYGDYATCEGGLMEKNWGEFQLAHIRRALAWMRAQNIAHQIQTEEERAGKVITVHLAAGRAISAIELAIGKLEAQKTTRTLATSTESSFTSAWSAQLEAWLETGFKLTTKVGDSEAYLSGGVKATISATWGGEYKDSQVDTTTTQWDPTAEAIKAYEGIKALKEAEKDASIEGANSAATIRNLLLAQSEALMEWEIATVELNQVVIEHNALVEKRGRLVNLYATAVPTIMSYNSHLLNPAYRLWRDSLTIQSSKAHALAAQFAYLTARASEYELLTPFPKLNNAYKTRTANDIRMFLDELKVWHQALDLPGQLNRYPYTLSVAQDFLSLTDEQLDPGGDLSPEALARERYNRLQEAFANRTVNGDLEIVFSTSLDQRRPGGHFVFSPNIWNNRIAGIGAPLTGNVGVRVNIITTEPVNAGVIEVVLVHDGQSTYRDAAAQNVIYDPATAVPVGYLIPAELSPAHTTVVLRPAINGVGGLANSGLMNLSVAASHWKLSIPAHSWGNLDVSQIRDIQISLDTTGRALPYRTTQAQDDAALLAEGLEMAVPSEAWLQELNASQQETSDLTMDLEVANGQNAQSFSTVAIPGQVSGSYFGNLVVTSPITIAVQELNFALGNVEGTLTGVVGVTDSSLSSRPISLTGTANGDHFLLVSSPFTDVVNGRIVTQTLTLVGHTEDNADVLRGVYTGTITNLLPEPIMVEGLFLASRPGMVTGNGLLVKAGTWRVPVGTSTPITVTLINGLTQPIPGTGTVTFTTSLGTMVPSTVQMVDGVVVATFEPGAVTGETVVVATMGEMTGQVRIEVVSDDAPIANAGADQQVDPGSMVTLSGSGSSDPNGDPLTYDWAQTGGTPVTFAPDQMITTFTAPLASGPLTFRLTVTDPSGLSSTDTIVVTVRNLAPTANAGPNQAVLPGTDVTLDGTASSDPNGDTLTYLWTQVGGTTVHLSSPNAVMTTFTAPSDLGALTFMLTVTDPGGLWHTDSVIINVDTTANQSPVANAGQDQQVYPAELVTLDGSSSSDPDGDQLTFYWAQTGGTTVLLASPNAVTTTFTAPSDLGELTFTLTVTDPGGLSHTDSVVITVSAPMNRSPVADAGPDQVVRVDSTVWLDGSGSWDPDGDQLSYSWVQTAGPQVQFDRNKMRTSFTAPSSPTTLAFELTVTDPDGLSSTDSVEITVRRNVPVAVAGADQRVKSDTTVTLDGSESSDPGGEPLTYRWVQTGGEPVSFSPTLSMTTFIAPSGRLTFTLFVTNTAGLSASDTTYVIAAKVHIYLPNVLQNRGPQAQSAPEQWGTRLFVGTAWNVAINESRANVPVASAGRSWVDPYVPPIRGRRPSVRLGIVSANKG